MAWQQQRKACFFCKRKKKVKLLTKHCNCSVRRTEQNVRSIYQPHYAKHSVCRTVPQCLVNVNLSTEVLLPPTVQCLPCTKFMFLNSSNRQEVKTNKRRPLIKSILCCFRIDCQSLQSSIAKLQDLAIFNTFHSLNELTFPFNCCLTKKKTKHIRQNTQQVKQQPCSTCKTRLQLQN